MSDDLSSKRLEMVFISHWFGHTPHFAECVLPFFLERGYRIYHLTDKPDEAGAFLAYVFGERASAISHLAIDVVEPEKPSRGKDAPYRRVEAHWRGVGSSLRQLFGELGRKVGIFHSWVDLYSHEYLERRVIEEAMPAPWCGLYVHPAELRIYKTWKRRLLENARDFLKQGRVFPSRLQAFDVSMARKIFFWDEGIPKIANSHFRNGSKLSIFPESKKCIPRQFSDDFSEIEYFVKNHTPIICLAGFLSRRKGLLKLIRVAQRAATHWSFLIAGEICWDEFLEKEKSEIQDFILNQTSNALFIPRHLSDQEFEKIIEVSDCAYVAYEDFFHSSNLQLHAAILKKPMISGPRHLIADRTRRFGMGWCLPEISEQAVADLLNQIDKKEIQRVIDSARFEEFCQEHSPERLNECLEEICRLVG
jgi:glycosyltransferase involved in cell wall biosynthesis